jgi:predicted house-cleaning NTP pyrophosphatase (Maf/HAM1 superfamily)
MILASQSPRRREICDLLGFTYTVIPATTEAAPDPTLPLDEAFIQVPRGAYLGKEAA